MTDRNQSDKINNSVPTKFQCPSGVPQGGHMGSFLYIMYSNDSKVYLIHEKLIEFADDTKLYVCVKSPTDAQKLQYGLDIFIEWCKRNKLQVNIDETKVLIIAKKRRIDYNSEIENENLEIVTEIRDFRLIIDQKLTFSSHMNLTIIKA